MKTYRAVMEHSHIGQLKCIKHKIVLKGKYFLPFTMSEVLTREKIDIKGNIF